jgi:hypothetical protein
MSQDKLDRVLSKVEASRRGVIKAMIAGAAFAVPLATSFTMNGLAQNQALALSGNSSIPPNTNQQ